MSLARLVAAFENRRELPIEIPEIRQVIASFGIQDNIVCVPVSADPGLCRGVYYQYTRREGVYGDVILESLIVFSDRMDRTWQRVICAKEMIHIMDGQVEKTVTEEELQGLLEKLLGPLSSEDYGLADLMAAVDKLALYQCLLFLFPDAARTDARAQLDAEKRTIEQIAEWASLPVPLTRLVVSDEWPNLKKNLISVGDGADTATTAAA